MSREYATVKPNFWIGKTGRAITRKGKDARIVAAYLMTSPHSNLIGFYYVALPAIAHETGLSVEEVKGALAALAELDFAFYDDDAEVVWVVNMARYQLNWKGDGLAENDKKVKGAQREYRDLADNVFLSGFYDRYADALHLTERRTHDSCEAASEVHRGPSRAPLKVHPSPFHAPLKGSRPAVPDQEQDHEQDQEREKETRFRQVLR